MKKIQIIDLVRSVCVLVVMASHYYRNVPMNSLWVAWLWGRFCLNGVYGVYLFFVVSGFLITGILANGPDGLFNPSYTRFYSQRIGRLWPLLFVFVGSGFLIFSLFPDNGFLYSTFFDHDRSLYGVAFWVSALTFSFNWFISFYPNFLYGSWIVLWSLAIEEQFYCFYPFVLRKLGTERNLVFFTFVLIVMGLAWRIFFFFHLLDNYFIQKYGSFAQFDSIAIGILLFLTVQRSKSFLIGHQWTCVLLSLAGFVVLVVSYFGTFVENRFTEIFVSDLLGGGLFMFLLGGLYLPIFDSKYLKLFSFPGKYCYGCYLLHIPIIAIARPFFAQFGVFYGFSIFVILTTVIAAVSYHWFELPTNLAIRRALAATS